MPTQDRLPTGDVNTLWSTTEASRFDAVNDPIGTPDDDTTYMYTTANASAQRFSYSAFVITSTSINKVIVYWRGRQVNPAVASMRAALRVNGAKFNGTTVALADTYADYDSGSDWLTNPDTGSAWTEADVEGTGSNPLQGFYIESRAVTAGVEEIRCTQAYITVDYNSGSTAVALAGIITATSTVAGSIQIARSLTGVIAATSTIAGSIEIARSLVGSLAIASTISGDVKIVKGLAGVISAVATISSAIEVARNMNGTISIVANVSGKLDAAWSLAGTLSASSSLSGTLGLLNISISRNYGKVVMEVRTSKVVKDNQTSKIIH